MDLSQDTRTIMDMLFAPLGKGYCKYYEILMYVSLITFVLTLSGFVYKLFTVKKVKMNMMVVLNMLTLFLSYFSVRLLYSMCVRSL